MRATQGVGRRPPWPGWGSRAEVAALGGPAGPGLTVGGGAGEPGGLFLEPTRSRSRVLQALAPAPRLLFGCCSDRAALPRPSPLVPECQQCQAGGGGLGNAVRESERPLGWAVKAMGRGPQVLDLLSRALGKGWGPSVPQSLEKERSRWSPVGIGQESQSSRGWEVFIKPHVPAHGGEGQQSPANIY